MPTWGDKLDFKKELELTNLEYSKVCKALNYHKQEVSELTTKKNDLDRKLFEIKTALKYERGI